MAYTPTPGQDDAQTRISALTKQIGEQVDAIKRLECSTEVDSVIAEPDKSFFIFKQNQLVRAYQDNEFCDERDLYIAELEEKLAAADKKVQYEKERWLKQYQINLELKSAIKSLAAVLNKE